MRNQLWENNEKEIRSSTHSIIWRGYDGGENTKKHRFYNRHQTNYSEQYIDILSYFYI